MKRPWILGASVAVVTIVVGVVLVLLAASGGDGDQGRAGASAETSKTTTTSTTAPPTTTTIAAATTTTTTTTGTPLATTTPETDPPEPPDPADAYQPIPLPAGINASIAGCGWSTANGGELQASGALTNATGEDDVWLLTVYWLWRNGNQDEEIDDQIEVYDLAAGQTVPWQLSISAPTPPPNVSCALEIE